MLQNTDYDKLLKKYDEVEEELFVGDLFHKNTGDEEGGSSEDGKSFINDN